MKDKFTAWAIHLGISALVIIPIFALIRFVWFPGFYFTTQGVMSIILILVGVDLVLGPLLTFIVYKKDKKGLKLDLSVIAALQIIALAYGVVSIHSEKPYALVFAVDRLEVLAEKDVDTSAFTHPVLMAGNLPRPVEAIARMPEDHEEYQKLLDEALFRGAPDLERRPEYWVPMSEGFDEIMARARPWRDLLNVPENDGVGVDQAVQSMAIPEERVFIIPLVGKSRDFAAVLDAESTEVVDVITANPWVP